MSDSNSIILYIQTPLLKNFKRGVFYFYLICLYKKLFIYFSSIIFRTNCIGAVSFSICSLYK